MAGKDLIRKQDALLSYHFNIPYPELLPDDVYNEKWEQLAWVLGFEAKRKNSKGNVQL